MLNLKRNIFVIVSIFLVIALLGTGCGNGSQLETQEEVENSKSTLDAEPDMDTELTDQSIIKIRVADYPPQYYKDENGQWTGLDVELAVAVVEKAGFIVEFVELPWSRALKMIETGDVQFMMNLSITPEREKFMNFIGPERTSQMILVVNEKYANVPLDNIDDLGNIVDNYGLKIGLQKDVEYSVEFNEKLEVEEFSKNFEYTSDVNLQPNNVANHRLFGFFEDKVSMNYQILNNPDFEGLALHPFTLSQEEVYFGVTKNLDKDKFEKLKAAFEELESDGTLQVIRDKY